MTKKLVLLVEDDHELSQLYTERLELEGFLVSTAYDGASGLEKAKKENPAAVLLDLRIPKLNGFKVLEALKQDAATAKIPVIILSALISDEDRKKCFALGAAYYLAKAEVMPSEVVAKVQHVVNLA